MNDKQKLEKLKKAFEEIENYMLGDEIKHFMDSDACCNTYDRDGDYDFDSQNTIDRLKSGEAEHIFWNLCVLKGLLNDEDPAKILEDSIREVW